VHRFTCDNHVFLELHPWHFLIKDRATKMVLHHDKVEKGLYPLKSTLEKQVFAATKPSLAWWHGRLGHPSSTIVQQVLNNNNLPASKESFDAEVCDVCQKGKAHQLPYPRSSSASTFPLELVFSDVWGLTSESINQKNYYVSFIDDCSKFVWIYTIKHRSKVFECFRIFKSLLSGSLIVKSLQSSRIGRRISVSQYFLPKHWHLTPCVMSSCTSTKWCCRKKASTYH
jgi:hypothetical protein